LLDEARELQQAGGWSLTAAEQDLIGVSARRARQRDRLRLLALALIVLLALLASALGLSALVAKRAAEARRGEAESLIDFMLGDFADKLRPLGRLDLLESVSGKALQYLSGADGDAAGATSPTALTLHAKGLQIIGEVRRSRGDSAQAIAALSQANTILLRQHRIAPADLRVLKNLAANAYWVGQMHKDQNHWLAADAALRDYLKFADLLHHHQPDNSEWWTEQSYAHNNLGALALTRGLPQLAVPEFAASIALKRRVLDGAPASPTVAADLADSYSWLASATAAMGQLARARQLYGQEIALTAGLRQRYPAESMWVHRHVMALQHRALMARVGGDDDGAVRDYDEATRLFSQIVRQDRDNRAWQVELANLEQERLRVLAHHVDAGELLNRLTAVHRTLHTMALLDPQNEAWARREALARARLAGGLLATGQGAMAAQQMDTALGQLQRQYASNPANLNARLAVIESLLLSATIARRQNNTLSAMMTCEKVYGMMKAEGASSQN
jgi:tetratricopeptide (TPR) repeat protein